MKVKVHTMQLININFRPSKKHNPVHFIFAEDSC